MIFAKKFKKAFPIRLSIPSLVCIAMLGWTQITFGQDESYSALKKQWADLEVKFSTKEAEMKSGTGDPKELRNQYADLVDEANRVVKKLKMAAADEVSKNPNNEEALRTCMGCLMNDAQSGNDAGVITIGDSLIASGVDPKYFETAASADRLSIEAKEVFEELLVRQREAKADDLPRVNLTTTKGDIIVELFENEAPNTVANFISLVESGHYEDILFHRVLEDFMAQTGGYKADGSNKANPSIGYSIACECYTPETRGHFSYSLSMAHAGQDTGGSQIFLTFKRTPSVMALDGRHTCFGRIIDGFDVLDKIERTHISINRSEQPIPNVEKDKIISAKVLRKRDHDYKVKKVGQEEEEAEEAETPPASPNLSAPESSDEDMEKEEDSEKESEDTDSKEEAPAEKADESEEAKSEEAEDNKSEGESSEGGTEESEEGGKEESESESEGGGSSSTAGL